MNEKWLGARITGPAPGTFSTEIARARRKRVGVQRGDHPHRLVDPVRFVRADALVEAVEVLLRARVAVDLLAHRREVARLAHPVRSTSLRRQGYAPRAARAATPSARDSPHEVEQLARAVGEARGRAPARAVLRAGARARPRRAPGAHGVDRHPELHPVAPARTAAAVPSSSPPSARWPLSGRRVLEPAARADRPPREAAREPEAARRGARAKAATASSARPPRTASTSAASSPAESPRSPSQSTNSPARRSPSRSAPASATRAAARHRRALAGRGARPTRRAPPPPARCSAVASRRAVVGHPQLRARAAPGAAPPASPRSARPRRARRRSPRRARPPRGAPVEASAHGELLLRSKLLSVPVEER